MREDIIVLLQLKIVSVIGEERLDQDNLFVFQFSHLVVSISVEMPINPTRDMHVIFMHGN